MRRKQQLKLSLRLIYKLSFFFSPSKNKLDRLVSPPHVHRAAQHSTVAVCYGELSYLADHLSQDRILQIPRRGSQKTEIEADEGRGEGGIRHKPQGWMNFRRYALQTFIKWSLSEPRLPLWSTYKTDCRKTTIHEINPSFAETVSVCERSFI